jgi:gamma-glutamyltranspeptidase
MPLAGRPLSPLVAVRSAAAPRQHAGRAAPSHAATAALQVLKPAIQLASEGFPVAPITAFFWDKMAAGLAQAAGAATASAPLLWPGAAAEHAHQHFGPF